MSELFHHDNSSFHPDLRKSDIPLSLNIPEQFQIIEVSSNYWPLWENIISAVKFAYSISIRELGPLLIKSNSEWVITFDCQYVYRKLDDQYSVHRLYQRDKSTLYFHIEPLFTTTIENYDHLRYITPIITPTQILVTDTNTLY